MKHSLKLLITAFVCNTAISQVNAQSNALKIQADGNVGIGTDTPGEKLQVEGNVKANGRFIDKTGPIMPVGTILPFAGSTAPPGWLLCNGNSYLMNGDQRELYAAIGNTYGTEGADRFRVPDLRETFLMGAGTASPADAPGRGGGPDVHNHSIYLPQKAMTSSQAGRHRHKFPYNWYFRGMSKGPFTSIDTGGDDVKNQSTEEAGDHSHSYIFPEISTTTGNSNDRNRPKWIAINYIIKY
ncbi:tail fiber protein [Chitinophaga rhizophila]|uniref:Phage tail protein n=1 Tax=Chitinophaga rhizophila TaxID=2866212 RepID=A0ABS7G8I9_9BACT|nr:tail fiber protein [Chitinophaga rhizophila]MBW8683012.1 phage tail protein [Chitinophaga rhizophila]